MLTKRSTATINWRRIQHQLPLPGDRPNNILKPCENAKRMLKQRIFPFSSNYALALIITIVIILVQVFIVHYYLGSHKRRQALVTRRDSSEDRLLHKNSGWFCYSFPHLNKLADLAAKHQVELVIVDKDLLDVLADERSSTLKREWDEASVQFSSKTRQEASHKSIIHLAAINETSGGQPNLVAFHDDLKNHYYILKYDDTSETMAPEVYRSQAHQLDDVQSDALRAALSGQQDMHPMRQRPLVESPYEISKIYTEFIAHLFILNTTIPGATKISKLCDRTNNRTPFIVIHLSVLYNYEFRPQEEWIQSSLAMDEIQRHKLLAYGVHSIDFQIPLSHNYIHKKRDTRALSTTNDLLVRPLKPDRPFGQLKVFEPSASRLLNYANNTYLHCKPSAFNISGLIDGNRKLNEHLSNLDASRPPRDKGLRALLSGQLSIAIQFMDVFSKTYGRFSYWLTGSSLLSYHKFCQLTAGSKEPQENSDRAAYGDYDDSDRSINKPTRDKEIMLDLEIGLFSNELDPSMFNDLSEARMIGVTMISNWRRSNSRVSFHVRDCPNILFSLHFYELKRDFYQHFYVTNDDMVHKHKFRRKKPVPNTTNKGPMLAASPLINLGHHVFTTSNLDLCWTRVDNIPPFRVPCDVHDHLRRIYVI